MLRAVLPRRAVLLILAVLLQPLRSHAAPAFPVIDLHVDLSYQIHYKQKSVDRGSGQVIAGDLLDAAVSGLVLPLYVPHEVSSSGPRLLDLESSYASLYSKLDHQLPYAVPTCVELPNRVRTWFSLEGAAPFAEHPEQVATWVNGGVKIWGLVHRYDNPLASSAGLGPKPRIASYGLTPQGRDVVRAIHAAHGIVDVSHVSDRAFEDILLMAREDNAPIIATHSNCRSLAPHGRNLTDAQIVAIAERRGVIGINFHGPFLRVGGRATLADVVAHIRHIVRLVGVEHVAIGSDFEGGIAPPPGLETARGYPKLATALLNQGFDERQVRQIFSGNALRLLACPSR